MKIGIDAKRADGSQMSVDIPLNDWKEDTQVREDVVQGICNAFLAGAVWHPCRGGGYRDANNELAMDACLSDWRNCNSFRSSYWHKHKNEYKFCKFTRNEMREAWLALRRAGYRMIRILECEEWPGYVCGKSDYFEFGTVVESFGERWG